MVGCVLPWAAACATALASGEKTAWEIVTTWLDSVRECGISSDCLFATSLVGSANLSGGARGVKLSTVRSVATAVCVWPVASRWHVKSISQTLHASSKQPGRFVSTERAVYAVTGAKFLQDVVEYRQTLRTGERSYSASRAQFR